MSTYQRYYHTVRDLQGNVVYGASCAVYQAGTSTLATIYDASSTDAAPSAKSNPFTVGSDGVVSFFALDGQYDVQITGGSMASVVQRITLSTADAGVGAVSSADLASTAPGKGAALISFHNAPLNVGNRDGATNSSDPVILASRLVDDSSAGNGHCFSDSSVVSRGGTMSYNSYDARFTVTGSNSYGHFAPFQNGMVYGSTGALGYMYGFVDVPQMTAGAVTYRIGVRVEDVIKTGGTIASNIGVWIDELTAGGTNWAIRQVGSTPSWFDGRVKIDGGIDLFAGPAVAPITSTGLGQSNFAGSLAATGFVAATSGFTADGSMNKSASAGLRFTAVAGSSYDMAFMTPGNAAFVMTVATGTNAVKFGGNVGFNAANPIAKPTVTGSRGGNAALASLLTALANYGLITDSTTA